MAIQRFAMPEQGKTCNDKSVRTCRDIHHSSSPATDAAETNYPPQDGGRGAWLFLFGACVIEVTAWGMYNAIPRDFKPLGISSDNFETGFPYCYGVFEAYFDTHPPFQGQNLVSTGGVLSNGVLQLSLPPVIYYVNNFPKHRIPVMWLGCLICTFSAIGAGFAKTVCKHSDQAEAYCKLTCSTAIATHYGNWPALRYRSRYAVRTFHPFDGGMVQGEKESCIWFHVRPLHLS